MMDPNVHLLHHVLNTDTFKYCLICMEDICKNLNFESEANPVKIHLRCPNHMENVKFLFKLCIPDLINDDSFTEDYFGIMSRSVFDISNLLGKNTCYICCIDEKHLVCLLCREEVSGMEFPCKKIKKKIISHLQSDKHLQSVKDTNWIFRFNRCKSFFRFQKSLLYCSICKESFQLKECNLLQFADSHLKNRHLKEGVRDKVPQDKGETKTSDCVNVGGSSNSSSNSGFQFGEISNSCLPFLHKKTKSYTCHLCLGDIELIEGGAKHSIVNHCKNNHPKCFQVQGSSLFMDIICFNQRFLDHKVILKKYPGIKVLSDCVPVFANNSKYIQIFKNICFCSLCRVMIEYAPDPNDCLRNFSTHFNSVEHMKVLKRKGSSGYDKVLKKKSKDLKRLSELPETKKSKKKKVD